MTSPITYDQVVDWDAELRRMIERYADPLFTRPEPKHNFADMVRALMSDVPSKNSWQLSDHVGHPTAHRFEWLLNGAVWDEDLLLDAIRKHIVDEIGSPDAVLVIDDTAVIKKGDKSVGVARQYCGLTGQVENCQVMPMLTYASRHGHSFIDRELYLPESWTSDPDRMREAGVPADRGFSTKPELAITMLDRALSAGVPFGFVAGDSGYGRDPRLRAHCHDHELPYVLGVPVDLPLLDTATGRPTRPDELLKLITPDQWERRSCGQGTKGIRYYDWAAIATRVKDQTPSTGMTHTLIIRRSISKSKEIAYFLGHANAPITCLIDIAGIRWTIEEDNKTGKDLLGLDQYQVRKWTPSRRHVTICMFAQAFLVTTQSRLEKAHRLWKEATTTPTRPR